MNSVSDLIEKTCRSAKKASRQLVSLSSVEKNRVLTHISELLIENKEVIQVENRKDLENGKKNGLSNAMLDRLELSAKVIHSIIDGINQVIALPDPVGNVSDMKLRPNGLQVGRMSIPLGVIGMIYESRPNVTVDAAVLCLKAGNASVLRGGSEAFYSNMILGKVIQQALERSGVDKNCIQVLPTPERSGVEALLQQEDFVDLIIPRGGEGLIRYVSENSKIPVLKHYKGVCHIFVDKDCDSSKAINIILNSKVQRPGVCNALEGILVHEDISEKFIPLLVNELHNNDVKIKGCQVSKRVADSIDLANEEDWGTEFLDLKVCLKVVSGFAEAKSYIETYGSLHTECIITENYSLAQRFIREIDASSVMVNASTRFNDGGELGLGTEIGISTTKLHSYGPMGLEELTTKKFIVFGEGQVRV